jgi:segregation and condensation protein B
MTDQEPDRSPEGLGQAYASMLEDAPWQVDGLEEPAEAAATAAKLPPPLEQVLEALLFVGGAPLAWPRASGILRGLTEDQFHQIVEDLNRRYRRQGRPYHIQSRGAGYSLALRSQFHQVQAKLLGNMREARLSTAAIDVLALVAYRQPATKAEVDTLRGADSGGLLRQLVRRGLIQVVYRADAQQREVSYGTTPRFLELFALKSLEDLPRTQDLQQI